MFLKLLRARLSKGMFPNEHIATITTAEGAEASTFVTEGDIVRKAGDELVRVYVIREERDVALVNLPGDPIQGGTVVAVPHRDLLPVQAP